MASYIARRKLLATLLGGAAPWPLAARAQQSERMRRIGVLMNLAADDPEAQARITAFVQGASAIGLDRRSQRAHRGETIPSIVLLVEATDGLASWY